MSRSAAFLDAVLGPVGAKALSRLAAFPGAADIVPPRAALAWIALQKTEVYGTLPGCPEIPLCFRKDVEMGGYQGVIGGPKGYAFGGADIEHVAAAICAFLEVIPGATAVKDTDMARLGKTIDLLVKAQQKPAAPTSPPAPKMTHETRPTRPLHTNPPQRGAAAAPQAPNDPEAQTPAETGKGFAAKKPPKPLFKVKIGDSQTRKKCSTCDQPLFAAGKFVGCDCMGKNLAKTVTTTRVGARGILELTFGAGWDGEAVLAILGEING